MCPGVRVTGFGREVWEEGRLQGVCPLPLVLTGVWQGLYHSGACSPLHTPRSVFGWPSQLLASVPPPLSVPPVCGWWQLPAVPHLWVVSLSPLWLLQASVLCTLFPELKSRHSGVFRPGVQLHRCNEDGRAQLSRGCWCPDLS